MRLRVDWRDGRNRGWRCGGGKTLQHARTVPSLYVTTSHQVRSGLRTYRLHHHRRGPARTLAEGLHSFAPIVSVAMASRAGHLLAYVLTWPVVDGGLPFGQTSTTPT